MKDYGSIERAEDACREWAAAAEAHLNEIPPSEARETMREMCGFLVDRVF
jgi:geranylgeranyl pyrophosphate synthase